jgi:cell fate (sporulation/competence/biofilm development) regulator YlbF (YheA/YmcA/DUF963 family)
MLRNLFFKILIPKVFWASIELSLIPAKKKAGRDRDTPVQSYLPWIGVCGLLILCWTLSWMFTCWKIMLTQTEEKIVVDKTRELCSTILAQSGMGVIRKNIDAFMADANSRAQYETLMAKGQELHEKQHKSLPLSGEEIGEFERQREAMLNNPVARGFLDAQEALHQLQESIQTQVSKTLELGRLPAAEDLESGSCGHGCGCHH